MGHEIREKHNSFSFLLATTIHGVARASNVLCTPTESVMFSCSTEKIKTIALCLDGRTRLVSYRYGRPERIEFSYSEKMGNATGFLFNHYLRSNVDYTRIAFLTAGHAIFNRALEIEMMLDEVGENSSRKE